MIITMISPFTMIATFDFGLHLCILGLLPVDRHLDRTWLDILIFDDFVILALFWFFYCGFNAITINVVMVVCCQYYIETQKRKQLHSTTTAPGDNLLEHQHEKKANCNGTLGQWVVGFKDLLHLLAHFGYHVE